MDALIWIGIIVGIAVIGILGYLLHEHSVEKYKYGVFTWGTLAAGVFIVVMAMIASNLYDESGALTLNAWVLYSVAVLSLLGLLAFNISQTNSLVGIAATSYQVGTSLVAVIIVLLVALLLSDEKAKKKR